MNRERRVKTEVGGHPSSWSVGYPANREGTQRNPHDQDR